MERNSGLILLLLACSSACATELPPLPRPVSNNAVTAVSTGDQQFIVSFNGISTGLTQDDILSDTFVFDVAKMSWSEVDEVPGGVGRLASTAATVGKLAYIFGGYSVAEDGAEVSTPWVHSFDPVTGQFEKLAPMPVPVDDAVSVTYIDRYIYLISGWHDLGNVNLVQRYDADLDRWDQATPIPAAAVFGHAGGIVNNNIVYCDGVEVRVLADKSRDLAATGECLIGIINNDDNRKIDWRRVAAHPGAPRYRMAAAGSTELNGVFFVGGSENPYNFNGIGYDGEPSEPAEDALFFSFGSMQWRVVKSNAEPTMDHRALVKMGKRWAIVGGMTDSQQVTSRVQTVLLKP